MTTLVKALIEKKEYQQATLDKIHSKNDNNIDNYSSKELKDVR